MIFLKPLEDINDIKAYFEKSSIEYNENSGCVICKDGETVLGFSLYDLNREKMVVKYIEPLGDIGLADGILRSTLHVSAERGVMDAFYEERLENFVSKINFIKNIEEKRLDIDKLFQSCCSCGK